MKRPREHTASYPSLAGRHVFITGGATGIGAEMVVRFAAQGARVSFVDIAASDGNALAATTGATFACADVTDVPALQDALADAGRAQGGVDVLINNVANDTRHDWRDVTLADWDRMQAVNLRPAFFTIQAVAPGMIARERGSIINYGSISWMARHGGMPGYTTAKAAIHGLTQSFVGELGAAGVRINTLLPGWAMTDRQRRDHFGKDGDRVLAQNQAMRGYLLPADVAAMALFLAADDSAMCTGQDFIVDGGWV